MSLTREELRDLYELAAAYCQEFNSASSKYLSRRDSVEYGLAQAKKLSSAGRLVALAKQLSVSRETEEDFDGSQDELPF